MLSAEYAVPFRVLLLLVLLLMLVVVVGGDLLLLLHTLQESVHTKRILQGGKGGAETP